MTATDLLIPTGRPIPRVTPGDPTWLQLMTGSKIAAVLGLSPWESPFSLWHRMAGTVAPEPQSEEMARGHYLEPAVCQWWADQHPEYEVLQCPTYVHCDRPWQAASPDRLAVARSLHDELIRILVIESKTDASRDGYGAALTDQIPVYYRAQIIWELDVLGLPEARLPMLGARLEFQEFMVQHNADEAEFMRAHGQEFVTSVRRGIQPKLDDHEQTYRTLLKLHPQIDGSVAKLPADLADRYVQSRVDLKAAEKAEAAARTEVAEEMGEAQYAVHPDTEEFLAQRIAGRGDNPPYVRYIGPKPWKPTTIRPATERKSA